MWFFNDESGSVSSSEFASSKSFMQSVADSLTLSSTDFQVGVVRWGTSTTVKIPLKDSAADFTTALSSYTKGPVQGDSLGTMLQSAYNNYFYDASYGARADYKKLIVYMTDAIQTTTSEASALIATANSIRDNGDDIIFILIDDAAKQYANDTQSDGVDFPAMFLEAAGYDANKIILADDYDTELVSVSVIATASNRVCTSAQAIAPVPTPVSEFSAPNGDAMSAVVNSTKRFAHKQVQMISGRMDWLRRHQEDENKSVQGVNFRFSNPYLQKFINGKPRSMESYQLASAEDLLNKYGPNPTQILNDAKVLPVELLMSAAQQMFGNINLNPTFGSIFKSWYMWTAGQITLGKANTKGSSATQVSESLNLAFGLDRPITHGMVGFAVNASKDMTDIGTSGSRQKLRV